MFKIFQSFFKFSDSLRLFQCFAGYVFSCNWLALPFLCEFAVMCLCGIAYGAKIGLASV